MLNLIFQRNKAKNPDNVWVDVRGFFDTRVEDSWFEDPFVLKVIKSVDGAISINGAVLKSFEGKIIPPQYLSTGSKAVICAYMYPDLIFNATQMGDNAFIFIARLSLERDITILTYRDISYAILSKIDFLKDYQPVIYSDDGEYWDLFDEWKEEIYND